MKKFKIKDWQTFGKSMFDEKWHGIFNNIINIKDKNFISENIHNAGEIIQDANDVCEHFFDILGSGRIKISYGLKAKGIEGFSYYMNINEKDLEKIKENIKDRVSLIFNDLADVYENDIGNKIFGDRDNYEPVDWHIDFKSGYRWDNEVWYKKIKYGDLPGVDVKVPWELSRCCHLVTLGQAYWLTGDERYTREFIYQIIDWITNNPVQFGVNWSCTMDVAIRICNWILSFAYFKDSKLVNDNFLLEFSKSVYAHGVHIKNNLEKEILSVKTNHYLSNIAGLLYSGIFFKSTFAGKKWVDFAEKELKRQMMEQIYPDGSDFEASTCYHRLVLELFLFPTIIAIKSEHNSKENNFIEIGKKLFGNNFIDRLYKMFEFVLFVLKPDGMMPQIGDNDNGRFHIFGRRKILEMTYLLTIGAIFFNEADFKIKEFEFAEEALWIFGKTGHKIWQDINAGSIDNLGTRAFTEAGLFVMRHKRNYLIVSAGSNGQNGDGGHAHNDKLSFELNVNRSDIIVDPGSYLYTPTPEFRNKFRSACFHNTVVVDSTEQNRFNSKSLFLLKNDAKVKVNCWNSKDTYDFLDAEHYGYLRLKNPVIHRRQIIFNKTDLSWFVRDILTGKGKHSFDLYFHLNNNLIFEADDSSLAVDVSMDRRKHFKIYPVNSPSKDINNLKLTIEKGLISHGYGEKIEANVIKYSMETDAPVEFLFVFAYEKYDYAVEEVEKLFKKMVI